MTDSGKMRQRVQSPGPTSKTSEAAGSKKATAEATSKTAKGATEEKPWFMVALLTVAFHLLQYLPYTMCIKLDPGCPMFLSFTQHLGMIVGNIRKLPKVVRDGPQVPWKYHFTFASLGLAFGIWNAGARSTVPASICELLRNVQMFVAILIDYVFFNISHPWQKIASCFVVVSGVAVAGQAVVASGPTGEELDMKVLIVGVLQMLGSLLVLTVLVKLVKISFQKHGECVEEQILLQHSIAIFGFLLPSTLEAIRPRFATWLSGDENWLLLLLVLSTLGALLHQWTNIQFAGRVPNLMVYNVVDVLKKFITLFSTVLIGVPPWPPALFWVGTAVLMTGSILFVLASADGGASQKPAAKADDASSKKSK